MRAQLSATGGGGWIPFGLSSWSWMPEGPLRAMSWGIKGEEGIRRAVVDAVRRDDVGSSHDLCRVSTVTGDNPRIRQHRIKRSGFSTCS
jgi:hypothetical protein